MKLHYCLALGVGTPFLLQITIVNFASRLVDVNLLWWITKAETYCWLALPVSVIGSLPMAVFAD